MSPFTLLALALVAYLPGALLFRLPLLDPRSRAALPAEERVFWHVILSVSFSSAVVLALAAAGWYRFERLLIVNAIVSAVLLVGFRGRLRFGVPAARPTLAALVPVALAAGALWLYGPPAEYVMGGKDPGAYINEGIQIAQRGTLVTVDPVVASLPAEFRDLFIPPHHHPSYYGPRFMGFFVLDPVAGTVLGQFPHLFPVSIAIGYGLHGLTGARQVPVFWTLLAVVAVYLAGTRLFGRPAAAAGAALLAINVIVVWYAGYPNAEMVALALLFAAMLAFSRAQVDGLPFFGPLAAVLVSLLLFLRFDMALATGAFIAAGALGRVAGLVPVTGFFPLLALGGATAAVYLFGLMQPYMALPIVFISNLPWWQLGALVFAALVVLALLAGASRVPLTKRLLPWLAPTLITVTLVAAAYAWFFRTAGGRTAEHDALALRSFAWYITPIGLAAALGGYVVAVRRLITRDSIFLLTLTVYAWFFFYKIRIVPEHYWMTRRFLPVVLPGALLLTGYLAFGRWRDDESRRSLALRSVAGIALVAFLAFSFWSASRPLFSHVEYAGLIPRLERLASTFGDRDLVLVESRDASDLHVLALPLAYIYAKNVLVFPNRRPDPVQLQFFLAWARTRYDAIYYVGGGGTELLSRNVAVEPVGTEIFQVPEWESARNALPSGVRRKEFDFSIYRFVDPATAALNHRTVLDIGINDDVNVVRFHAKERHQNGTTFRWSRDVSYISLPGLTPENRTITLVMEDGHRPPQVPPAQVELWIDDRLIGRTEVDRDFEPYSFTIPEDIVRRAAESGQPVRIKLVTNTWRPNAVLPVNDDRELGVMLDLVEVR
ncbi:MAG TPA: hypothetical protein VIL35_12895 [Vicinamibacterales bacterium]